MKKNQFAPDAPSHGAATDEPASPAHSDILDFEAVPLRYREDGLTPDRQREYVEALADCGIACHAAARIGVSEQAVNRVRRRSDARAFDRACAAALRIGARRLVSVAFERAIEGTIKRHTYHGEIVSEERVYDNRLLMSLIGKLPHLFEPEAEEVERDWQPWMEAVEQGLPEPPPPPEPEPEPGLPDDGVIRDADGLATSIDLWEEDDGWWTSFPPPDGFDGDQRGWFGDEGYKRRLSKAEQAVNDQWSEEEEAAAWAAESARRDRYFGLAADEVFSPRGHETYETSADAADDSGAVAGLAERADGGAAGPARTIPLPRHCEERSDEAIQQALEQTLDCFAHARNDGHGPDPASNPPPPSLQPRLSTGETM